MNVLEVLNFRNTPFLAGFLDEIKFSGRVLIFDASATVRIAKGSNNNVCWRYPVSTYHLPMYDIRLETECGVNSAQIKQDHTIFYDTN